MLLWRRILSAILAAALLAGCDVLREQTPGRLSVRSAVLEPGVEGVVLDLDLDCRLSGPMQDALEHGIPITLVIEVGARRDAGFAALASATRHVELRYHPLTRRYQLRDLDAVTVRNFAAAGYLLDALGALHLSLPPAFARLPAGARLEIGVALDRAALPGALRLPALFEPAWWLAAPEYAWTATAG